MPEAERPALEELAARVTELELLFTHLQQTVQDLNESLLLHARQAERLSGQITRLTSDLSSLSAGPPAERNPLDERPPHY